MKRLIKKIVILGLGIANLLSIGCSRTFREWRELQGYCDRPSIYDREAFNTKMKDYIDMDYNKTKGIKHVDPGDYYPRVRVLNK